MESGEYYQLAKLAAINARDFIEDARVLQHSRRYPRALASIIFAFEEISKAKLLHMCSVRPDNFKQWDPFAQKKQHAFKLRYFEAFALIPFITASSGEDTQSKITACMQEAEARMLKALASASPTIVDTEEIQVLAALTLVTVFRETRDALDPILTGHLEKISEEALRREGEYWHRLRQQLLYVDRPGSSPTKRWEELSHHPESSSLVEAVESGAAVENADYMVNAIGRHVEQPPQLLRSIWGALSPELRKRIVAPTDRNPKAE